MGDWGGWNKSQVHQRVGVGKGRPGNVGMAKLGTALNGGQRLVGWQRTMVVRTRERNSLRKRKAG